MAVSLKSVNNNLGRLLLCGVSATCFVSLPAYADNVYLLQLGSFDSRDQAEQKWQDLKSQNSDVLSSVQPHITEISMGDDSKTSYRTEAGPINSKAAATKLCSQLQAKGAECSIVETAMYTSDEAAPAHATVEATAAPVTPASGASAPAPAATPNSPPSAYVAGREPKFLDSDNPVTEVAAAPAQEEAAATPQPAPSAAQQQPHDLIVPERAPRALNEDEVTASREQAMQIAQTEPAKQETAVSSSAKVAQADDDDENESPAQSRRPSMFGHATHRKATEVTTRTAAAEVPAPAAAETSPSPAESKKPGFFSSLFGSSPAAPAPETKPTAVTVETPPSQIATVPLPPVTPAAAAPAREVQGNVSVAEAVRVPLEEPVRKSSVAAVQQHPTTHQTLTVGGMYWAQINYFSDEQQAHNFYEHFRSEYPEVSDGVRMTISRPYAYAGKDGHVTLKMGSFATPEDISAVCAVAAQQELHCVSIKEGSQQITMSSVPSPSLSVSREHIMAETSVDKTPAPSLGFLAPQPAEPSSYWVQLGSFDSPDDAWDKWRDIKRRHKKAVNKVSADVSQPDSSSALHKLFRLRAGPYGNEGLANALCNKLIKAGEDCLVVEEQK